MITSNSTFDVVSYVVPDIETDPEVPSPAIHNTVSNAPIIHNCLISDCLDHTSTIISKIGEYSNECLTKSQFHRKNARNAMIWWNFLGVLNVVLTASQALSMTIQAVNESEAKEIAITGGVFAFSIAISSRIKSSFSFNVLSLEHHHIADDYDELIHNFRLLLNDIDRNDFNEKIYEQYVHRFISVSEKSHVQTVKSCGSSLCF
jgi:hypothetical protein